MSKQPDTTKRSATLRELIDAGSALSDIAFSLSKRTRSAREAAMLREAHERWDAAIESLLECIREVKPAKKARKR